MSWKDEPTGKSTLPTIGQAINNALDSLEHDLSKGNIGLLERAKAAVSAGKHITALQAIAKRNAVRMAWEELPEATRKSWESKAYDSEF